MNNNIKATITYKVIFDPERKSCQEVDIPYGCWETVWYCYKKRNKYAVYKSGIKGIWATNIIGVILDNDWHVSQYEFDRLFKDKDDAIDWCLKQNQRKTVKVYE